MDRYFVDFLNFEAIFSTEFTLELHLLVQITLVVAPTKQDYNL